MARNAEIKIRIAESRIPEIVAQAIKVGGSDPKILEQEDVYFPAAGRLKVRSEGSVVQLIGYSRSDETDSRVSHYQLVEVKSKEEICRALRLALGEPIAVVRKTRTLVMLGQTRIHLDRVEGLGSFLELEVMMRGGQSEAEGCHMVEEVLERIGVKERDVERGSYKELMKLYKTDKDS